MDTDNPNLQNNNTNMYAEFLTPTPPPVKKSPVRKMLIIAGGILIVILVIFALIVAFAKPNTSESSSAQAAISAANTIITTIDSGDFAKLSDNLTSNSPFNSPGFSIIAVNNAVGVVDYTTCAVVVQGSYDTEYTVVDSINTEVVYIPYTCKMKDSTESKTLEFDMQRSIDIENADWKLNYIVVKESQS